MTNNKDRAINKAIEKFVDKINEELVEEGKRIFATGEGKYKSLSQLLDKVKQEVLK